MKKIGFVIVLGIILIAGCGKQTPSVPESTPTPTAGITGAPEGTPAPSATPDATILKPTVGADFTSTPIPTRVVVSSIETEEKKGDIIFSAPSGAYSDSFLLELTTEKAGNILFTLDGSDPAESATAIEYTNPISISDKKDAKNVIAAIDPLLYAVTFSDVKKGVFYSTIKLPEESAVDKATVVRAVVKYEDGSFSQGQSHTYFIGEMDTHISGIKECAESYRQPLCVISLSVNYDDLFDEANGIYMKGTRFNYNWNMYVKKHANASAEDARKLEANYTQRGKEYEKKVYMEMLEVDETGVKTVLSQDCGIRIQGNYSRSDLLKGLRLYARGEYGEGKFKYPVFGEGCTNINGKVIDSFDTLVLRAGGNTTFQAKFNDAFWQEAMKDMNVATQTSRPCVVYINGEYFGLYVLEEDYTDNYFNDHYKVPKDDVVVYKGDAEKYATGWKLDEGKLPEGVTDEGYFLKELQDFYSSHANLKNQADYEAFCKIVDPDSVLDYFVGQVFINNKWDWPGKNWVMWCTSNVSDKNEYTDGRWRLALLDLDFGGVSGSGEANANTVKEANYKAKGLLDMRTDNPVVLMFAYLMTNKDFEDRFTKALLSCTDNTFSKETLNALMEKYEGSYMALFDQYFRRYPGTGSANDAVNGGYASAKCIKDFYRKRGAAMQSIVTWIEKNSTAK